MTQTTKLNLAADLAKNQRLPKVPAVRKWTTMEEIEDPRPNLHMRVFSECTNFNHDYHIVGFAFYPNSILSFRFESCRIAIPFEWMLPLHLKKFLAYSGLCPMMLTVHSDVFAAAPVFAIHCHCPDSMSLQCIAGRGILVKLISDILAGGAYNLLFKRYREIVNKGVPDNVKYIASIYYKRCHYIYFKTTNEQELERIMKNLRAAGKDNNIMWGAQRWIIYQCRSCDLTGVAARRCMKRARKFLGVLMSCSVYTFYDRVRFFDEDRAQGRTRRLLRWGSCACDKSILVN